MGMADPLQHPPAGETGSSSSTSGGFLQRALHHTRHAVATGLRRISVPSLFSGGAADGNAAELRLHHEIRLITVLSVLLAVAETGRALVLLRRQSRKYRRQHACLVAAGGSLERSVDKLKQMVGQVLSPTSDVPTAPEGTRDGSHTAQPGTEGGCDDDRNAPCTTTTTAAEKKREAKPAALERQTTLPDEVDVVDGGDEEDIEDADSTDLDDADKDIRVKTPLQLVHYWKQMEKAVLTSGNRQPFALPLPERTCDIVEPQTKKRRKALMGSIRPSLCPAARATPATATRRAGTDAVPATTPNPRALVLPIEGCFLYEKRPDVFDFVWREADEREGQRVKQEEEAERAARQGGKKRHGGSGASSAHGRRLGLPPSASSRGLLRFDTIEDMHVSPRRPPASPVLSQQQHRGGDPLSSVVLVDERDAAWRPPLKWEALFLIWGLSVDYSITIREVRQLLLSASPPAFLTPAVTHGDGPTPFDVSSANLSLLWFLANVRLIYTAIIVHGDIQKAVDEMDEVSTYMSVIQKKCIARWPSPAEMHATWQTAKHRNNVWLVCAVQGSWQTLSAAYDELLSIRFTLSLSGVWHLAKYMYASSKTKYVSAVLIAALTALNSRVTSAGRLVRGEINMALAKATGEGEEGGSHSPASSSSSSAAGRGKPMGLGALCCYELGRLVLNYVLVRTTSEFIALTAGLRKDAVRAELYEALAHMPLGYFDVRTFDEVEGIIYSVDDLEGIDVQVNQYVFGAANTLWMLREALSDVHSGRVLVVAATTASLPHVVPYVGRRVKAWYDDLLRAGAFPWLLNPATSRIDVENEVFHTDGVLLRGSEIIGAVHQLRPYGADTRLTHWWNLCTQYEPSHPSLATQHNSNGGMGAGSTANATHSGNGGGRAPHAATDAGTTTTAARAVVLADHLAADAKESGYFLLDAVRKLVELPHGKLIPGVGKGVLDLVDWLLPVFVNALGAWWCGLAPAEAFRLLDCASAMESGVNVVVEGLDVAQMLLENGYKAAMLERVLSSECWETTSMEEGRYLLNYVSARDGNGMARTAAASATSPSPTMTAPASLSPSPSPPLQAGRLLSLGKPSVDPRGAHLYRHYLISKIHFRGVQFRYPSSPAVDAFPRGPFTAVMHVLNGPLSDPYGSSSSQSPISSQPLRPRRGNLVCITGSSGSGKSTILNLLLALYTNYTPDQPGVGIDVELLRRGRGGGGGSGAGRPRGGGGWASGEGDDLGFVSRTTTWGESLAESHNLSYHSLAVGGGHLNRQGHHHHQAGGSSYHWSLPATLTVDIRQLPVDVLRSRLFSYVPQTPTIFSGATIAQNISLAGFVSIATDDILEKVEHCAALACCGPFVKQLPAGLLTRICDTSSGWCNPTGVDGRATVRLTPDQLQRIMIARALYHGGQVLLMDEPTANVDTTTAAALREMWLSLLADGTVKGIICATHDAELLAEADQVIALPS